MKYWKGIDGTSKQGQFGTMDDTGFVPDSVECTQAEYQQHYDALPKFDVPDYKSLYSQATTDGQRLGIIAGKLGLI